MRTVLACLYMLVAFTLAAPLLIILYLLKDIFPMACATITQALGRFGMRAILLIAGCKVDVYGKENIPKDTAVLFASNHRSAMDILLAYGYTRKTFGFISKKEHFKIPVLRRCMQMLNCLFIDRKDNKQGYEIVHQAAELIKKGFSIWICPEGTRNKSGGRIGVQMFHNGSYKIAAEADAPVIPVAIYGSREAFEQHMPWLSPSHMAIEYGKPVMIKDLSEEDRKHIGDYFSRIEQAMLLNIDIKMGKGPEGRFE